MDHDRPLKKLYHYGIIPLWNYTIMELYHYGIREKANEWFCSYLSDRSQFVSINGFDSEAITVGIGVPQGSVLGPYKAIKFNKVHNFADDTNLFMKGESLKKLKKMIKSRSLIYLLAVKR